MPFLVDSVAAAISARGRTIERLLHPVIDAGRTASGRLVSVKRHDPGAKIAGQRESLIFIEMERADARTRATIAGDIAAALDDVRLAVRAWKPMLDRLDADVAATPDPRARAFLRWLAEDTFPFLGHNHI